MKHEVKAVFCTSSTSANPILLEVDHWDELIVDEAALECMASSIVPFGTLIGRVGHILWAGHHNHKTGTTAPSRIGSCANLGGHWLSRNIFEQLAEEKQLPQNEQYNERFTGIFNLNFCYRMTEELFQWPSQWYHDRALIEGQGIDQSDMKLRVTLAAFFRGMQGVDNLSPFNVGIDLSAPGFIHEQVPGQDTALNYKEAEYAAWLTHEMVMYNPPKGGRRIEGQDIYIITAYSGQVRQIRGFLYRKWTQPEPPPRGQFPDPLQDARKYVDGPSAELEHVEVLPVTSLHGRERPIVIYSSVLANGTTSLAPDSTIDFSLLSNGRNLYISLTRQKIARIMIGALQMYCQAKKDDHSITKGRNAGFFNFFWKMKERNEIISFAQIEHYRDNIDHGRKGMTDEVDSQDSEDCQNSEDC